MAVSLDKSSDEMENSLDTSNKQGDDRENSDVREAALSVEHNGVNSLNSSISETYKDDPLKSGPGSEKSNGTPAGRKYRTPQHSPAGSTPGSSKLTSPTKMIDPVKQKEREERIKAAKEKAAEDRKRKLMELRESQQRAEEFRRKQEEERKRKLSEARKKEEERRRMIEERRKRIHEEESKRLKAILQKAESKADTMKSRRSLSSYGFGSRTPRMVEKVETSPGIGRRAQSHGSLLRKSHAKDTSSAEESRPPAAMTRSLNVQQRATSAMNISRRNAEKNKAIPPSATSRSKSADVRRSRADLQKTIDRLAQPKVQKKSVEELNDSIHSKGSSSPKASPRVPPSQHAPKIAPVKQKETPKKPDPVTHKKEEVKKTPKKIEPPPKRETPKKAETPKQKLSTSKSDTLKKDTKGKSTSNISPSKKPPKAVDTEKGKEKDETATEEIQAEVCASDLPPEGNEKAIEKANEKPTLQAKDVPVNGGDAANNGMSKEEEYKAKLAEKRREAREKAQREAEEKQRQEEERQRQEEERIKKEQEEEQRFLEEQRKLQEEAKRLEEERLQKAIEAEEQRRKEEEERLERERIEKEEAEKRAKEDAEKREQERILKLQKEEEERQARKKRLEMIMKRVKTDDNKSDESPSPSKSNVSPPGSSTPENEEATEKDNIVQEETTPLAAPAAAPVAALQEEPSQKFKSPLLQKMMQRNKETGVKSAESSDDEGRGETKVIKYEDTKETTKIITRDLDGNITQEVHSVSEDTKVIEEVAESLPEPPLANDENLLMAESNNEMELMRDEESSQSSDNEKDNVLSFPQADVMHEQKDESSVHKDFDPFGVHDKLIDIEQDNNGLPSMLQEKNVFKDLSPSSQNDVEMAEHQDSQIGEIADGLSHPSHLDNGDALASSNFSDGFKAFESHTTDLLNSNEVDNKITPQQSYDEEENFIPLKDSDQNVNVTDVQS